MAMTAAAMTAAFLDASPALAVSAEGVGQITGQIERALGKEQIKDGPSLVKRSSCWTCSIFTQIYDLKEKFAAQLKFPIQDKLLPLLRQGLIAYLLFIGLRLIYPGDTSALQASISRTTGR